MKISWTTVHDIAIDIVHTIWSFIFLKFELLSRNYAKHHWYAWLAMALLYVYFLPITYQGGCSTPRFWAPLEFLVGSHLQHSRRQQVSSTPTSNHLPTPLHQVTFRRPLLASILIIFIPDCCLEVELNGLDATGGLVSINLLLSSVPMRSSDTFNVCWLTPECGLIWRNRLMGYPWVTSW